MSLWSLLYNLYKPSWCLPEQVGKRKIYKKRAVQNAPTCKHGEHAYFDCAPSQKQQLQSLPKCPAGVLFDLGALKIIVWAAPLTFAAQPCVALHGTTSPPSAPKAPTCSKMCFSPWEARGRASARA
eukprot:CAMPEP_0183404848 /NCGR_PEP_ID=MMETSP0370-20130417/15389_1 /TAXON_ID=268820 /ORGANISM="Peridinium aciculiferum, Strain PAER-2" /LENGTH=125 /DNA_ID=CAMNT_0025586731 /DNA_START=180 /DNA_END=557 /DNA_ORIENTATION=-